MANVSDLGDRMIPASLARPDWLAVQESLGVENYMEMHDTEIEVMREHLSDLRKAGRVVDDHVKEQIRKTFLISRVEHAAVYSLMNLEERDPDRLSLEAIHKELQSRRLEILDELGI